MSNKSVDEFKEFVKKERNGYFKTPYELVYQVFCENKLDEEPSDYFVQHASEVVDTLRSGCWDWYVVRQKKFISKMLTELIDEDSIKDLSAKDAISVFIETYPEHMYQLSLSTTNSRRSRAGKEFEAIIELILMGAGIAMDTQGNIGKQKFVEKKIGKLVDLVSPGVVEYSVNKRHTVLISAKTTLRERWQEVPEEMSRTGASQMYLATLDDGISQEVLDALDESNITITTTKAIKDSYYPNNPRVMNFEELIGTCKACSQYWDSFDYTVSQSDQIRCTIEMQMNKHKDHQFVLQRYADRLKKFTSNE